MEFWAGAVLFLVVCLLGYLAYETYVSFNGPFNKKVATTSTSSSTGTQVVQQISNDNVVTSAPATPARPVGNTYNTQYAYTKYFSEDVAGNDISSTVDTLDGCQVYCNNLTDCAGFTRPSSAKDFVEAECNMKSKILTHSASAWNTYNKSTY
jgi:hypothetical protein